jgi:hypothetical protein
MGLLAWTLHYPPGPDQMSLKKKHWIITQAPLNVEQPFKAAVPAFVPAFRQNARKNAVMGWQECPLHGDDGSLPGVWYYQRNGRAT